MASMITINADAKVEFASTGSPPPWNMRVTQRRRRQPKGVREEGLPAGLQELFHLLRIDLTWRRPRRRFRCRPSDVFILDELQENFFQGRCADAFATSLVAPWAMTRPFLRTIRWVQDFLHDFEDVRTIEDGLSRALKA